MRTIEEILESGEGLEVEFKGSLPTEPVKWMKTVVAFANGSGGVLLIGVADDGTIIGLSENEASTLPDTIVSMVCDYCEPQIPITTHVQRYYDNLLVVVQVFPGINKPFHIKELGVSDGTFVRVGATTRKADSYTVHDLSLQGTKTPFDSLIDLNTEVSEDKTNAICRSLSTTDGAEVTKTTLLNSDVIRIIGDKEVATNAYSLLSPDSRFHFYEVRCAVFCGSDELDFLDKMDISCPIQQQISQAFAFVKRNLRKSCIIRELHREEVFDIPLNVVREAIVNAVQHRSYIDPDKPVYIALYDDRLEITSPGGVPAPLTTELMRQGRSSHRNPSISKVFRAARLSEGWGNGIRTIYSECRRFGLPEPMIENSGLDVRITIFRRLSTTLNGLSNTELDTMRWMDGGNQRSEGWMDGGNQRSEGWMDGGNSTLLKNDDSQIVESSSSSVYKRWMDGGNQRSEGWMDGGNQRSEGWMDGGNNLDTNRHPSYSLVHNGGHRCIMQEQQMSYSGEDLEEFLRHPKTMMKIISLIENDPGITTKDLSYKTGIPVRSMERVIADLRNDGILIRTGRSRSGQWVVKRRD